jgi:hypothetical protein
MGLSLCLVLASLDPLTTSFPDSGTGALRFVGTDTNLAMKVQPLSVIIGRFKHAKPLYTASKLLFES